MPYSLAISPRALVGGTNRSIKTEESVTRQIRLLLFSKMGECRYNPSFGSGLWESDFDLSATTDEWRDKMKRTLAEIIRREEPRINLLDLNIAIKDEELGGVIRKCLAIDISGVLLENNQPYQTREMVLLNPLS